MRIVQSSIKFLLILVLQLIMTTNSSSAQKYLFYLHGAIMEGQKGNAKSGSSEYQYDQIIDGFKKANFNVVSEIRKSGTDVSAYAKQVVAQIEDLLKKGVKPSDITVVGASKGSVIAMYVSTFLKNSEVNFVIIAACNDGNFQSYDDIRFYGNILSIYDKSDDIGESCIQFKNRSGSTVKHYKEISLNTGKGHQFLWAPLPEWMNPATAWANGKYD